MAFYFSLPPVSSHPGIAGGLQGCFRGRLARVTVREAIDVRLRTLGVVLGRVPPPTEEWLEADARLADSTSTAWDVQAASLNKPKMNIKGIVFSVLKHPTAVGLVRFGKPRRRS